jgi:metal-responsive CopG/Arc/MetJ family transcriptional regulator
MRLQVDLDDELVAQLDRRVDRKSRSSFIGWALRRTLDEEQRWEDIEAGLGALAASEHEWDADPAGWVEAQRRIDPTRVG